MGKTIEIEVKFIFDYDKLREEAFGAGHGEFFDALTTNDYGNLTLKDIEHGMKWEIDKGIVKLQLGNCWVVENG